MRYTIIIAGALALAGCKSEAEKKSEFITFCSSNEFSLKQCEVLYLIAKSSADARDNAEAANIGAGMAIGAAVSSGSRR